MTQIETKLDAEQVEALEGAIDTHGLDEVVYTIGKICVQRCWEIRENESWKGDVADNWERCGKALKDLAMQKWF